MDYLKSSSKKYEHANFSRGVWSIKNGTFTFKLVQDFEFYDSNSASSAKIISKPLAVST